MLNEEIKELASKIAKTRERQKTKLDTFSSDEDELFKILHDTQGGDEDLQTLFHRLNYQRVVDKMDSSVEWWKWGILTFSIISAIGLYVVTNYFEPIITKAHGLYEYENMIKVVNQELNHHRGYETIYLNADSTKFENIYSDSIPNKIQNTEVLEHVTESYFNTYFLRYILIRLVLITILITLITSGIKVYMRMRRDRMVLTVKEEGTTTTLYLFKKFLSIKKEEEYSNKDRKLIAEMLPSIISELYHIPNSKDVRQEKFSLSHKMMGIMEKMATNQRTGTNK